MCVMFPPLYHYLLWLRQGEKGIYALSLRSLCPLCPSVHYVPLSYHPPLPWFGYVEGSWWVHCRLSQYGVLVLVLPSQKGLSCQDTENATSISSESGRYRTATLLGSAYLLNCPSKPVETRNIAVRWTCSGPLSSSLRSLTSLPGGQSTFSLNSRRSGQCSRTW